MSPLLQSLNHLLREALGEGAGAGPLRLHSVVVEEDGARIVAQVADPLGQGELVLRLEADAPAGSRHTLRLRVEQAPARWSERLEPFRGVIERARLTLDLDFGP